MLVRLFMSLARNTRMTSSLGEAAGNTVRRLTQEAASNTATTGRLNFLNSQRSCCPLKVCGTPACPINKMVDRLGELPNGRTWTMKPK